jgi:hypothetical protein
MIALCVEHAAKADGGAYTKEQLLTLKREGRRRAQEIQGLFEWMRRDLLAIVGGTFYYRQRVIFQINDKPCIWFNRDNDGYLLLNFLLPTATGYPRVELRDNVWTVPPDVRDLECPPRGRKLTVHYSNGDQFSIEFFDIDSVHDLTIRYPNINSRMGQHDRISNHARRSLGKDSRVRD